MLVENVNAFFIYYFKHTYWQEDGCCFTHSAAGDLGVSYIGPSADRYDLQLSITPFSVEVLSGIYCTCIIEEL